MESINLRKERKVKQEIMDGQIDKVWYRTDDQRSKR